MISKGLLHPFFIQLLNRSKAQRVVVDDYYWPWPKRSSIIAIDFMLANSQIQLSN
jgi:hypothetical protein